MFPRFAHTYRCLTRVSARCAGERLAIDIAVNSALAGTTGADGRVPSDAVSGQTSSFEEEPDELEVDLDKPWEKPSKEKAKIAGKVSLRFWSRSLMLLCSPLSVGQ